MSKSSSQLSTANSAVSPTASQTSTTYTSSPLGQPICEVSSPTNYNGCFLTTGVTDHWDAGYMDQALGTNPVAAVVSVMIAFPGTGQPSTFLQSGGWIALGMAVDGQSHTCCGNDYAILAMLYVPYSGQPMILAEDWVFNDVSHNTPALNFGEEWTCSCLTTSTYSQLTTLTMRWTGGSLYWDVTIGGVLYTLSNSYTPSDGQQTTFHIGTSQGSNQYDWFQFGVMTPAQNPLSGWNAYVGSPRYQQTSGIWVNVQKSTWFGTTLENLMDDYVAIGGYLGPNQGESCSTNYNFPGTSPAELLLFGQLIIHPAGSTGSGHSLWDSSCPQDVYPPSASFVGITPADGAWQNGQFTVSMSNVDNGPVVSEVALCFWSVESFNSGSWVTTLPAQLVGCNSSQTVSVGGSGYCQSQGSNYCRVKVWSEDYLGNIGGTTTRYFSIDTIPPTAPTLVSPANGATIPSNPPTLSWSAASDASSGVAYYTVQVSSDSSFSSPQSYSGITTTSYSLTAELSTGTWYWRVGAVDNAGNIGPSSGFQSIIVAVSSSFTYSPNSPQAGDSITFSATSSGGSAPLTFSWSSSGGQPSTGSGSTYHATYVDSGSFTIVLTSTDARGYLATSSQIVYVHPFTLVVSFTYTPPTPAVGQAVTFAASSSGGSAPYTFSWNFGDTGTNTGVQASHSYASSGCYAVMVTTTDSGGRTATSSARIGVGGVPCGDFTISANPTALSPGQGSSTSSTITLNSVNSFAGIVTLSVSVYSPYAGYTISAYFGSNSPTATASISPGTPGAVTLTISVGCSYSSPPSTLGTYTVTVVGTVGSPTISHSIRITVTVASTVCGSDGSVAAGTLITLANGDQVPVQSLQVGMRLLAYNMTSQKYVVTTITRFTIVQVNTLMIIQTKNGSPLRVDQNPAQKVYVKLPDGTVTLMSVTSLKVGYDLFEPLSGTWVPITAIHYINQGQYTMYDIYDTTPGNYIANGYLDPTK